MPGEVSKNKWVTSTKGVKCYPSVLVFGGMWLISSKFPKGQCTRFEFESKFVVNIPTTSSRLFFFQAASLMVSSILFNVFLFYLPAASLMVSSILFNVFLFSSFIFSINFWSTVQFNSYNKELITQLKYLHLILSLQPETILINSKKYWWASFWEPFLNI